jgi:hypothetical protein
MERTALVAWQTILPQTFNAKQPLVHAGDSGLPEKQRRFTTCKFVM